MSWEMPSKTLVSEGGVYCSNKKQHIVPRKSNQYATRVESIETIREGNRNGRNGF
jgi:hypothetical protein